MVNGLAFFVVYDYSKRFATPAVSICSAIHTLTT